MGDTIQVNARMSRKLKDEGDAALARIGLSPTQAIRALWEKAAKRGEDLAQVEALLVPCAESPAEPPTSSDGEPAPDEATQRVYEMIDDLYRQLGIDSTADVGAESARTDDSELLAEAMNDRMRERGLA